MADNSKIEWCDASWNPIVGCSLVSPGCTNCYAMRQADRMRRLTIAEFHAELKAQGVGRTRHFAFRCAMCGTVQSMADFVAAGRAPEQAEKQIGFSCIGRWTNAGPFRERQPPGRGCDWTLGGLLTIHQLEVIDEQGRVHPRFEPATPEEAQAHAARSKARAT